MGNIFVTSDLHLGHQRDFLWGARGFNSIEEHDEEVIRRWNEVVGEDDEVFVLGDLMLNDDDHGIECLKRLNGIIYIAYGNHDTMNRIYKYATCENVDDIEFGYRLKSGKWSFLLGHYPQKIKNFDDPSKVYSLCGHSHTTDRWADWDMGCYHVELDAHDCYPVSLEQIKEDIIKKRMEK